MTDVVEREPGAAAGADEDERSDAFISYSHHDREFAVRLRQALEARGQQIWLDESEIHGGSRWSEELERAIDRADTFLFLISPDSATSPECGKELEHALAISKRILPIRVRETPIESLPKGLSAYQLIPARELFDRAFDQSLDQLITEIETDRDWVREHTDWNEKAREWETHDRNSSYLLSGAELNLAEQFRGRSAGKQPGLSTLQNEYIDASRQAATRRLRRTRAFVSVALVVAIVLSVVALIQRQDAITASNQASSGRLAAESVLEVGSDPQLSLLLAAQAAKTAETPAALDALRRAIPANHLIRTFQVDTRPLDGAQLTPNGEEVLTESEDGYARLWSVATGKILRVFTTVPFAGQGGGFDAAGNEAVIWEAGKVTIVNLADPSAIPVTITADTFAQLESAVLSPDGSMLATASGPGDTGSYTLWDARTGKRLHTLEIASANGNMGGDIAFSPNGQLVATGSDDGIAAIWNAQTGHLIRALNAWLGQSVYQDVPAVSFSPDGSELLIGAGVPPIQNPGTTPPAELSETWDVGTGHLLKTFNGGDPAWDASGTNIVTTNSDGIARVWQAASGKVVSDLETTYATTGQAVFGPEQSGKLGTVATGSGQGLAAVWNGSSGQQLALLAGDTGSTEPVGFSTDGKLLLTSSNDGAARVWSTAIVVPTPLPAPRLPTNAQPLSDGVGPVDPLAPLVAATVGYPSALLIVNPATGATLARLPGAPHFFYDAVAFDPARGAMLVMTDRAVGNTDETLPAELRSTSGGAVIRTLQGSEGRAVAGTFSPDGTLLATINTRNAITVWNVASGRPIVTFRGHVGHSVKGVDNTSTPATVQLSFGAGGRLILSSDSAGASYVWNSRTGSVLNSISGPAEPQAGMFSGEGGAISPNGQLVATYASWSGTVNVYRVGTPRELTSFTGTNPEIDGVAFSPDSSLLATITDTDVNLWDTRSQTPIETISDSLGDTIAFTSADRLVSSYTGSSAVTFPCDVCGGFPQLLAAARARETRGFTPQERALYLDGG